MLARYLAEAGYHTGHPGKWRDMGGQRDVSDAPPITDYGFEESLTWPLKAWARSFFHRLNSPARRFPKNMAGC